jgi:hypothetical protein
MSLGKEEKREKQIRLHDSKRPRATGSGDFLYTQHKDTKGKTRLSLYLHTHTQQSEGYRGVIDLGSFFFV